MILCHAIESSREEIDACGKMGLIDVMICRAGIESNMGRFDATSATLITGRATTSTSALETLSADTNATAKLLDTVNCATVGVSVGAVIGTALGVAVVVSISVAMGTSRIAMSASGRALTASLPVEEAVETGLITVSSVVVMPGMAWSISEGISGFVRVLSVARLPNGARATRG